MINEENKVLVNLQRVPLKSEREEIRQRRIKRFLIFLLCVACLIVGALGGSIVAMVGHSRDKESSASSSAAYDEIRRIMDQYWLYGERYEDLDQELEDKALYGMTAFDFDPYTTYMSEEEMNSFSDSINGFYVGIGVEYSDINGTALILRVFKSSPAERAGLQAGDVIRKIDGEPVEGMTTQDIKDRVLGIDGTPVVLEIERGTDVFDVEVIRGVVNSTVFAYTEDDYVVMELNSFGDSTAEECMKYLDEYSGYEKIIIDLREDTGGYQSAVRDICGLFIGPGEVYLRQKGVDGTEMVDRTPSGLRHYKNFKKIVLLTSGNTASAAEVFVIALKEKLNDVTIVGETTFGKGVIQTNRILSNGGVLKLTSYYWYSPNGVSIHDEGIHPDVEVRMPEIYYQYYTDMKEDEFYSYDSISEPVRLCQLALDYLGYEVDRYDGYFDHEFEDVLVSYKEEHGLGSDPVLDRDAYSSIISLTRRELANNTEKDTQLVKAKEIMNEDQH